MKNLDFRAFLLPLAVAFYSWVWGSFEESYSVKSTTGSTFTFKKSNVSCESSFKDPYFIDPLQAFATGSYTVCSGSAIKKNISGKSFVYEFSNEYCQGTASMSGNKWSPSNSVVCSAARHWELY
tara:strand:- start:114 stop:485 length:372 start_codon:yes stop_codon:yes gene_type:complete